jgi:hypothetical protein
MSRKTLKLFVILMLVTLASCSPTQSPITNTPETTVVTTTISLPSSTVIDKPNPIEEYAFSLSLPESIIAILKPLGEDGMDHIEKCVIFCLASYYSGLSISDEAKERLVDTLVKGGLTNDELRALEYLHSQTNMKEEIVDFGLDGDVVQWLNVLKEAGGRFSEYAVENKLCIQDKQLTDLEKQFLLEPVKYTQTLIDNYLHEIEIINPEAAESLVIAHNLENNGNDFAETANYSRKVCLIVTSNIYESLIPWLDRWRADVEKTGVQVDTKTISEETPDEIRTFLRNTPEYSGCMMVGDVPTVKYSMDFILNGAPYHEEFPTDLYYMDLDGEWEDTDGDSVFDTHTGNIAPEIWVGRLITSNLPSLGGEIELLQNYFDKNHLYRIGGLTLPYRALMYVDEIVISDIGQPTMTYEDLARLEDWESDIEYIYEETVVFSTPEETNSEHYLAQLEEGWSLVRLLVHSGGFGHHFLLNGEWDGRIYPSNIIETDPRAFFFTIVSCGDFNYTISDYIGGCYVFSDSFGLLGIGDSGVHDLLVAISDRFFPYTKQGFGDALLYYLQECIENNARVDSVHNAVMLGDPLLMPIDNGKDSDSDGLTDIYELATGLNPETKDSDNDGISDLEQAKFNEFLRLLDITFIEEIEAVLTVGNPEG